MLYFIWVRMVRNTHGDLLTALFNCLLSATWADYMPMTADSLNWSTNIKFNLNFSPVWDKSMRRIFKKDRTLVTHILYFHSVVTISTAPSGQSPIATLTNHHHLRLTILEVRSPKLVPLIQLMCGIGSFLSMHIGFLAVRGTLVPCPCYLSAEGHSSCWRPLPLTLRPAVQFRSPSSPPPSCLCLQLWTSRKGSLLSGPLKATGPA